MKKDPPMRMAAEVECLKVPLHSKKSNFMDKLFVNKPVAIGYNTVQNPD